MVIYLIYDHNGHICLRVCIIVEMCHHGRVFSPFVCDIKAITDSAVEGLSHFIDVLLAAPPECDQIHRTGGLNCSPVVKLEKTFVTNSTGRFYT